MVKQLFKILIPVLLMCIAVACGKDDDKTDNNTTQSEQSGGNEQGGGNDQGGGNQGGGNQGETGKPTVIAVTAQNVIRYYSATVGAEVTDRGSDPLTDRGVCWGTSSNITTANCLGQVGGTKIIGKYKATIGGLQQNTTYYYRAYATNAKGTSYSDAVKFTTKNNSQSNCIKGDFEVSSEKFVVFSSGNLQYQKSTDTWRLAEHQYTYIGDGNNNIGTNASQWLDLFGWGSGNNPTVSSTNDADYATFVDWGEKCRLGAWRTLSRKEFDYLLKSRDDASRKNAHATVAGVHGIVLLPEGWILPEGCTFTPGLNSSLGFATNDYSASQWQSMEAAGAVFLPAAGHRNQQTTISITHEGSYNTSTAAGTGQNYILYFTSGDLRTKLHNSCNGFSVRLAHE